MAINDAALVDAQVQAELGRPFAEEIGKGDARELTHGGAVLLTEDGAGILIGREDFAGGK